MSGGSFNYLCYDDLAAAREGDLKRMAAVLRESGFVDAAEATGAFLRGPTKELRDLWQAVEWWTSADWSFEEVVEAAEKWRESL